MKKYWQIVLFFCCCMTGCGRTPAPTASSTPAKPDNFERERLELKARYDKERQVHLDALNDPNIPQIGITMEMDELAKCETKYFKEISEWRLRSAASPEERYLIVQETREVTYQLALVREKIRRDNLARKYNGEFVGSGVPGLDLGEIAARYEKYNARMLLPRDEAMKEREIVSHKLRISCKGREYVVDPGCDAPFLMYYTYSKNEDHDGLFVIRLEKTFDYAGRRFAVFNLFLDVRGFWDGSGNCFVVAELKNDEWKSLAVYLENQAISDCEFKDGVLTLFCGWDKKQKYVLSFRELPPKK